MALGRKPVWIIGGIAAVVAAAVALALFQPWKLVVDRTVADPDPLAGAPTAAPAAPAGTPAPSGSPAAAVLFATSTWKSYEHETSGQVRVYALPGGRRVLRLRDLDTSNGPDLRVYLSRRAHTAGDFGGGAKEFLSLGRLKGNKGDSNYDIPGRADLAGYKSVVIWCERFSVPFGAAPLGPA